MKKEIPKKSVGVSEYPIEYEEFLKWRGCAPTITICEAFNIGYEYGYDKGHINCQENIINENV